MFDEKLNSSDAGEEKIDAEKTGQKAHGKVIINIKLCKGCGFCVNFCPRHTLIMSNQLNEKGYHYPIIDKNNCTGCDLCGMMCPDFAIYAYRLPTKNN